MSYYLFIQLGGRSFSTHRWAGTPLPTAEGTRSVDRKDFRKIDRGSVLFASSWLGLCLCGEVMMDGNGSQWRLHEFTFMLTWRVLMTIQ